MTQAACIKTADSCIKADPNELARGLAYYRQLLEKGTLSPARRRLVEQEIRKIEKELA